MNKRISAVLCTATAMAAVLAVPTAAHADDPYTSFTTYTKNDGSVVLDFPTDIDPKDLKVHLRKKNTAERVATITKFTAVPGEICSPSCEDDLTGWLPLTTGSLRLAAFGEYSVDVEYDGTRGETVLHKDRATLNYQISPYLTHLAASNGVSLAHPDTTVSGKLWLFDPRDGSRKPFAGGALTAKTSTGTTRVTADAQGRFESRVTLSGGDHVDGYASQGDIPNTSVPLETEVNGLKESESVPVPVTSVPGRISLDSPTLTGPYGTQAKAGGTVTWQAADGTWKPAPAGVGLKTDSGQYVSTDDAGHFTASTEFRKDEWWGIFGATWVEADDHVKVDTTAGTAFSGLGVEVDQHKNVTVKGRFERGEIPAGVTSLKAEVQTSADGRTGWSTVESVDVATRPGANAAAQVETTLPGTAKGYVRLQYAGTPDIHGSASPVAEALAADFTAAPGLPVSTLPSSPRVAPLTTRFDFTGTEPSEKVRAVDVDLGDGTARKLDKADTLDHTYKAPGAYEVKVTVENEEGVKSTVAKTVQVDYAPSGYVATEPFRLLDTRTTKTPVKGGAVTPVDLPLGGGASGQPLSRSMASAVLNVTVTDATQDTHLTVWASGQPRPSTSNVNVRAGGTSSNTVTVPVGADGRIQAQLNSGSASLIVDFVGYYQPNAGERFSPLAPTRVLDTRTTGGALPAAKTRTVKVAGVNGIPADAKAVALNLTGTGATQPAHVIAYPDAAKRPATSNLNVEPGKDKSNQVIVPVGPNGTITLFTNTGSTHLVLDAVGYYGKDGKALFTPVVPKRLADTRTTGKVAPGATTTVSGLPANAVGGVLNVTATDSTGPGFLTAYAFGGKLPGASSLNTLPGLTVPNHVTTPVGPGGKVSIFNSHGGPNHVITDLLGYFTQG
ncbi:PKD domain-containing protein [Streptomyces sp. NPDC058401]|uniref:PKD domain-containing protein n=1 Tax=Streptomyces sp. NPDC058401 TaxID=3346480 RepID=UPI00364F14E7